MRMLRADVQALTLRVQGDADKAVLGRIADELRYSDPVHVEGLEGIEAEMGQTFTALRQQALAGEDVSALAAQLSAQNGERSLKCKVLKQQRL
jgi:hypothetical protein